MATDGTVDPQNLTQRKTRLNDDGSHTPYVRVENPSGGGGSGGDTNLIEVGGAAIALGQTTEAASLPVALASDDALVTATGAQADSAASSDTGTFSLISLFKRLLEKITTLNAKDFATTAKQDTIIGHVDGLEGGVGASGDAAATAGSTGSLSAKQRLMTSQLDTISTNTTNTATSASVLDDWDESDRAKVNPIAGQAGVAAGAGASGATTQRVVQANDAGKTILSAGGSASSSGNNTLVAAGSNKIKVKAFSLTTTSTTAVTCIFQSGAGGTELWRVVLQAPSGASTGANLSVNAPDYIFATASATLLNLNLSSANAVHWSVSYFDEA